MTGSGYYLAGEGSAVGGSVVLGLEVFKTQRTSISLNFLLRPVYIDNLKNPYRDKTLKILPSSYGDQVISSDSSSYKNFTLEIYGFRATVGLTIYLD